MAPLPLVRLTPRITANDLALYMVSSETAKLGIIRRAKNPQAPPIIRYKDVRPVVCAYLSDDSRSANRLIEAEEMFAKRKADDSLSDLRQDDARASILVLQSVQGMNNRLAPFTFRLAPHSQPKVVIAGVEVSVRADLVVRMPIKGVEHSGAAVMRFTQDDADTEAAKAKRKDMGLYVATMVRKHIDQNMLPSLPVSNRLCLSIDVQHGEVFQAPDSNARRVNDLDAACKFIAAVWDSV